MNFSPELWRSIFHHNTRETIHNFCSLTAGNAFVGEREGGGGGMDFGRAGRGHSLGRMAICPHHEKLLLIGWPLLKLDEWFPGCAAPLSQ